MTKLLDQFSILLLDMNGTFMFGEDRFGLDEDFHATYRALGGTTLSPNQVRASILGCYEGMLQICRLPQNFDDFPSLAEGLRRYASAPEAELPLLERVFAAHERGSIPPAYAALLCRLSQSHQLGRARNRGCPSLTALEFPTYLPARSFLLTPAVLSHPKLFFIAFYGRFRPTRAWSLLVTAFIVTSSQQRRLDSQRFGSIREEII